jgi:hypothetical protein
VDNPNAAEISLGTPDQEALQGIVCLHLRHAVKVEFCLDGVSASPKLAEKLPIAAFSASLLVTGME